MFTKSLHEKGYFMDFSGIFMYNIKVNSILIRRDEDYA